MTEMTDEGMVMAPGEASSPTMAMGSDSGACGSPSVCVTVPAARADGRDGGGGDHPGSEGRRPDDAVGGNRDDDGNHAQALAALRIRLDQAKGDVTKNRRNKAMAQVLQEEADQLQAQMDKLVLAMQPHRSDKDGSAEAERSSRLDHLGGSGSRALLESQLQHQLRALKSLLDGHGWLNSTVAELHDLANMMRQRRERDGVQDPSSKEQAIKKLDSLLAEVQQIRSQLRPLEHMVVQSETEVIMQRLDELLNIPPSVERALGRITLWLKLLAIRGTAGGDQYLRDLDTDLAVLADRLVVEQHPEACEPALAQAACSNLRALARDGQLQAAAQAAYELLSRVQCVDLHETFRLLAENEKATPDVEGQDLVLFLGSTGGGKSTTIHYLSGSEMVQQGDHIEPRRIPNLTLSRIRCSPEAKSETRFLTVAKVDFLDVGILNPGSFLLCDSPGFGDTEGAAVEISNCLGIIRAVKRCASVKPVILVSSQVGDRMETLCRVARTCANMVSSMEHHVKAFTFLFTKFESAEQLAGLRKRVTSVLDNLKPEENDPNFKLFLQQMQKIFPDSEKPLLDDGPDPPQPVFPLRPDERPMFLRQLVAQLQDPHAPPHGSVLAIHDPASVFRSFVPEQAGEKLTSQHMLQQAAIQAAYRRGDLPLLAWKLDQVSELARVMDMQVHTRNRDDIERSLKQIISVEGQEALGAMRHAVEGAHAVHPDHVASFQSSMARLTGPDTFKVPMAIREAMAARAHTLKSEVARLACTLGDRARVELKSVDDGDAKTAESAASVSSPPKSKEVAFNEEAGFKLRTDAHHARAIFTLLSSLQQVALCVPDPAQQWVAKLTAACTNFINECCHQFRSDLSVSSLHLQLCGVEHMETLRPLVAALPGVTVDQLVQELQILLVKRVRLVTPHLSLPKLNPSQVNDLSVCAQLLDDCEASVRFAPLLEREETLQEFRRKLPLQIQEYFERACSKADVLLSGMRGDALELTQWQSAADFFAQLQESLSALEVIRRVPSFQPCTDFKFQELIEKIRNWLQDVKATVLRHLKALIETRATHAATASAHTPLVDGSIGGASDDAWQQLQTGIALLANSAWFAKYRPGSSFHDTTALVSSKILAYARDLLKRLQRLNFSLQSAPAAMLQARDILLAFDNLVHVEEAAMQAAPAVHTATANEIEQDNGRQSEASTSSSSVPPDAPSSKAAPVAAAAVDAENPLAMLQRQCQAYVLESVSRSLSELGRLFDAQQSGVSALRAKLEYLQQAHAEYAKHFPADILLVSSQRESIVVEDDDSAKYEQLATLQGDIQTLEHRLQQHHAHAAQLRQVLVNNVAKLQGELKRCNQLQGGGLLNFLSKLSYSDREDLAERLSRQQSKLAQIDANLAKEQAALQGPLTHAQQLLSAYNHLNQQRNVHLSERQKEVLQQVGQHYSLQGGWSSDLMQAECSQLSKQISDLARMQLDHAYLKLEPQPAERALSYLDRCSDLAAALPGLARKAQEAREQLVGFIESYRKYTSTQLERAFEEVLAPLRVAAASAVSQKHGGGSAESVAALSFGGVSTMSDRLAELQRLSTDKFPLLRAHFLSDDDTPLFYSWQSKLAKRLASMQSLRDLSTPPMEVRAGMLVARDLIELDPFLAMRAGGPTFNELAGQLRTRWEEKQQKNEKVCSDLLTRGEFKRLNAEMQKLRSLAANIDSVQSDVQHAVAKLMQQVNISKQRVLYSTGDDVITRFAGDWQQLQTASHVREWLSADDSERLSQLLQTLPGDIKSRLTLELGQVQEQLKLFEFSEAERHLLAFESWRVAMASEGAELAPDVVHQYNEAVAARKAALDQVRTQLAECTSSSALCQAQPSVMRVLHSVEAARAIRTDSHKSDSEVKLFDEFRDALHSLIDRVLTSELSQLEQDLAASNKDKADRLHGLEALLADLPDGLRDRLQVKLKSAQSRIQHNVAQLQATISEHVQRSEFKALADLLAEHNGNTAVCRLVNNSVTDKMHAHISLVMGRAEFLATSPSCDEKKLCIVGLKAATAVLHDCASALKAQLPEVATLLGSAAESIVTVCVECVSGLRSSCNSESGRLTPDALDRLERRLSLLSLLVDDPTLKSLSGMSWPAEWAKTVSECRESMCRYLSRPYIRFGELEKEEKLKCSDMRDTLELLKQLESKREVLAFLERFKAAASYEPFRSLCNKIVARIRGLSHSAARQINLGNNPNESEEEIVAQLTSTCSNLNELKAALDLQHFCNITATHEETQSYEAVVKKLEQATTHVNMQAQQMVARQAGSSALSDLPRLSYYLLILHLAEQHVSFLTQRYTPALYDLLVCALHAPTASLLRGQVLAAERLEQLAGHLIWCKHLANAIVPLRPTINQAIDTFLLTFMQAAGAKSSDGLEKLGQLLPMRGPVGAQVVEEHSQFQGVQLSKFAKRVAQKKLSEVLSELGGTGLDGGDPRSAAAKDRLKQCYETFESEYRRYLSAHNRREVDFEPLVPAIAQEASRLSIAAKKQAFVWSKQQEEQLLHLLAHVFGIWTLENNKHYWAADHVDSRDSYLLTPHATQVLGIFRMLGIGDGSLRFQNNLVEIGTGEGKSVTLAIVSCVLALTGANVSCACYSHYLSSRDYDAFVPLFRRLNVLPYIRYGTFNKICEGWIERQLGGAKLREGVETLITNTSAEAAAAAAAVPASAPDSSSASSSSSIGAAAGRTPVKLARASGGQFGSPGPSVSHVDRVEVLLIDEVDVFLDKSFYGSVYPVRAMLRHPAVRDVCELIWRLHKANISRPGARTRFRAIESTDEVKALLRAFPGWEDLLREAVKDMLAHVATHKTPDYVVIDGQIKYKQDDTYSADVVYGYRTLFSHMLECEAGRVRAELLAKAVHVGVACGDFSYAAFPLAFSFVMGVTGTLRVLSSEEKAILRDEYGINKETYAASMYNKQAVHFTGDDAIVLCDTQAEQHRAIAQQIQFRLMSAGAGKERAVLVVFEDEVELASFQASGHLPKHLASRTHIINEQTSDVKRKDYVREATQSNRVTLTTAVFGRGTDYIVRDQLVQNNGGMHVMQTFFSRQYSQEVQVKGRTCRQGDAGSFNMVLFKGQLEPFYAGQPDVFTKLARVDYDNLHARRLRLFDSEYKQQRQLAADCKPAHEQSMQFLRSVQRQDVAAVKHYLLPRNLGAPDTVLSRTLVLMDATGSMGAVLDTAKGCVREMLKRVGIIMQDNKLPAHAFELQFAVYRNYGIGAEKLLEASSWENSQPALQPFLDAQEPEGGQWNEAIEIGLWHANQEHARDPLSQVIVIGDASPNTVAEVKSKRESSSGGFFRGLFASGRGEKYWSGTPYQTPTHWQKEAQQLASNGVPVHTFWLTPYAKASFEQLAALSGGSCSPLNVQRDGDGADVLTAVVAKAILSAINANGVTGAQLVQAYNSKFGKGFTA